ncbi:MULTISPECIES: restriction endonuclease subunit S [unclassified Pantoea]|uniref:restriction endonuclease subunit S n=1 Tax=unclassified Pantoea TaxID=2630326 RepID=UPI0024773EB8|nr:MULTISPECIES: restriction endonuclease subunit S [unclassified Pantoea]GME39839.1 restriction endonuclease subunit S [Pantoea sp. QMID1]GME40556.1 restriction endonuclease subunit S [Pantoea sp. QMID3]GME54936.1 restriction endonuclease subunit S [Pantoea sp. QMID4]GME55939.1 restriction endonuclease subunit S [Pantoea sp. QMID2]
MSAEQLITQYIDTWTSALQTRSTAGRGNNGKIDLYGIKKLRELILELAVRGKLVPQDPNDEPASELLKRIAAEKADLVKQGKIKKQKPLPEISEDEKPFELPTGWEWAQFGQVLISRDADRVPLSADERLKRPGIFDYYGASGVIDKIDGYIFDKPLLLVGEDGANLINRSTPIAFMAYGKYWVNNHAHVLDGHTVNLLNYICLYINAINLEKYVTGTAQPKMNQAKMNTILIGLPPEQEQNRIVQKVNELMSLCDHLEQQSLTSLEAHSQLVKTLLATLTDSKNAEKLAENWARISQHFDTLFTTEASIDALKQTILQLAVMGKLVPQDPHDEPASELLKRIEQEKAQLVKEGKIKKQKSLPPVSDEEKPFGLPVGWEWCRLAEMSHLSEAGWSPQCESEPRINDEWGVLKISAVTWGEYNPNENKALPHNLNPKKEYEVRERDFLISRANTAELVARSVIVPSPTVRHLMLSDKIIRYQFTNLVSVEYLNLMNNCSFSRDYYSNVAGGTSSSMKNVSRNQVSMLPIALPPYKEQLEIIKQVTIFNRLCTKLKSHLQSAQQTQLHLADALTDAALS